ncbi:hypothetical protein D3C71_2087120 [compost metagenome]
MITQVVITTASIQRDIVVAVTGQSAKTSITIECITSGSIRDQTEKLFITKIVNPRVRSLRGVNDILFANVIELSEFHK